MRAVFIVKFDSQRAGRRAAKLLREEGYSVEQGTTDYGSPKIVARRSLTSSEQGAATKRVGEVSRLFHGSYYPEVWTDRVAEASIGRAHAFLVGGSWIRRHNAPEISRLARQLELALDDLRYLEARVNNLEKAAVVAQRTLERAART